MARYLAVGAVRAEGRPLPRRAADRQNGAPPPAPPEIPKGRRLVAVVHNGAWQLALDVTAPSVYQRLHRRYREGVWTAMELFLIDEIRATEIEDGRRVLMNGEPVKDPGRA